jgi:ubiquinone/menaquinone biosynthesis C-methylase UbiE
MNGNKSNSPGFPYIAEHIFAPIYPVIADYIIKESRVKEGICLDMGCGISSLGIAIAEITDMQIYGIDFSGNMCVLSKEKALRHGVSDKVFPVLADVHLLPFGDNCTNLIVSRGSVFFWKDLSIAFGEIARVLAPNGQAWIGGGFGTKELKKQISEKMLAIDPEWHNNAKERLSPENIQAMQKAGGETGLACHTVHDDSGFWVVINKGE